jgi:hypothetical protein
LLVTTRAEQALIPAEFIGILTHKVDDNCIYNKPFADNFVKMCGSVNAAGLLQASYERFIPIGLAKLIADIIVEHRFEIETADVVLLVRDSTEPSRWLLHIAFLIKEGTAAPKRLRRLGLSRRYHLERRLGDFVEKNGQGARRLAETTDWDGLNKLHGETLLALAERTIDLSIPEPE